jgi:3-oxoacyl-[acyl-carrier-protein] synthase II
MKVRVAITGMGALTPLGHSVAATWERLVEGCSGIRTISRFDASGLPCRIAGEIADFQPSRQIPRKLLRHLDPFVLYALIACEEAMTQAGLVDDAWDGKKAGVVLGSSRGGITTLESNWKEYHQKGFRGLSPHVTVSSLINQAPAIISRHHGILGPSIAVSTACASGAHAIGQALQMIRTHDAQIVITGGAEAPLTPLIIGGFARARALSRRNDDPAGACRPFDQDRDGFVIAEGAGILVLERWEHARARGAEIMGEILGFGMTSDAFHMTAPDPQGGGMARAMVLAMEDAGLGPDEIDLVNAHGTGTLLNDRIETLAIGRALGRRGSLLPVCAVKSMTGHMLGASGAVEAIASVMAAGQNIVPPILNLERPDPRCALNHVRGEALRRDVSTVLSSSFAFGGANAALVIRGFSQGTTAADILQ